MKLRKDFNELHWHTIIQSIGLSLISIFIPIYFFDLGFSPKSIYLYYFVFAFFFELSALSSFLFVRMNFKKLMLLRPVGIIVSFALLLLLKTHKSLFFYVSIITGLLSGYYWVLFNYFFAKKIDFEEAEDQVGFLFGAPRIFSLFVPLLGSLVLNYFGFNYLFILSIAIIVMSIVPLAKMKNYSIDFNLSIKNLFKPSLYKYLLGFVSEAYSWAIFSIIIPLYIYVMFRQPVAVGFLSSVMNVNGFIVPLLIATICKEKSSKYIKIGAALSMLFYVMFFFAKKPFDFFLVFFLISASTDIWRVPFYTRAYKHAAREHTFEFMIVRETVLNITKMLVFLLMAFSQSIVALIVGAIVSLSFLFMF